jgi:hypothetical protein
MKIDSLFVKDFLGLAAVDVSTAAPVQLFVGPNAAGKSSLRDAVALAVTADLGRVGLKKEAPQLIRSGADLAVCGLITSDGDRYEVSISAAGKVSDSLGKQGADPVLSYVLDAQRFARLDATERRAFLFGLMRLETNGKAIVARLAKRGAEAAKVERIAPLLRNGFDAACKEARAKATEAKGAWRALTGETYGSEKAKAWRANVPAYDESSLPTLTTELQHCDVALGSWQQQIGKLQGERQRRAGQQTKLPALVEHAGRIERIRKKLATDEAELARLDGEIAKLAAAAGVGPRVGLVHDLAAGVAYLLSFGDDTQASDDAAAALDAYEREFGKVGAVAGDPVAAAKLGPLRESRQLCGRAVANDQRDLQAALQAQTEAETIRAELATPLDDAALIDAQAQAAQLQQTRQQLVAQLDAQKALKAQAEAAAKKTTDAATHAADVAAWDRIADALAPDGIPGEILAEALGPLNDRLQQAAADTDWPAVVVASDMAITAGGREYRLLSESERWRSDAMLAEAVANLSGTRLLVLDRFDVLDQQGRGQLLGWLDTLADTGEIDTALVFGTLKGVPTNLPPTIAAHWIENGICGQLKEAA